MASDVIAFTRARRCCLMLAEKSMVPSSFDDVDCRFRSRAMTRAILAALVLACAVTSASAQKLSSEDLTQRAIERRAIEAAVWGMPAVNYRLMYEEMVRKTGGGF